MRRSVSRSWHRFVVAVVSVASVTSTVPAWAAADVTQRVPLPRATVPSGFTDTAVTSVSGATTIVGLPDGRVVVLAKSGTVRVVQNGSLVATPALTIPTTGSAARRLCTNSEQGMLGFAIDPVFPINGFVYLYYTRVNTSAPGGCVNRVGRFTMSGNVINPNSEVILLDNIGAEAGNHNGGDVEIGNDGYLYVSVGDGGRNPRNFSQAAGANEAAQDLSLLNGKILRVDRATGFAAPDNPLVNVPGAADCRVRGNTPSTPATACRELYAWGLRNPWRFAFDYDTGTTRFNINDVGQNTREEVNVGQWAGNYGWPAREGQCRQGINPVCPGPNSNVSDPNFDPTGRTQLYCRPPNGTGVNICTQPIADYPHSATLGGDYITGAAFVPDGAWDGSYDGGYFYADGNPGKIFFRSAGGGVSYSTPFASNVPAVADIAFVMEPTGWALYYTSGSSIRKITYNFAPPPADQTLVYQHLAAPVRAFDSRNLGADSGPLRLGTSRLVDLDQPGGAAAALVNITMTNGQSNGYVAAWPAYRPRPATSVVNAPLGTPVANAQVVPLSPDGKLMLYTNVTTNVIVDVMGFFVTDADGQSAAGRYEPGVLDRIADTRDPSVPVTNPYSESVDGADTLITVNVPAPADTAAVALIVTAIGGGGAGGHAVVYPNGAAVPTTSNVNIFGPNDRRPNLVVVGRDVNGDVQLRLRGNVTDVVVDSIGSFTSAGAAVSESGLYVPVAPQRVVDTRIGLGLTTFTAGQTKLLDLDDRLAVMQNLTLTQTGGPGFLTAYSADLGVRPDVSNANATAAGQARASGAITALSATGAQRLYTSFATDLVVDVYGYFTLGM